MGRSSRRHLRPGCASRSSVRRWAEFPRHTLVAAGRRGRTRRTSHGRAHAHGRRPGLRRLLRTRATVRWRSSRLKQQSTFERIDVTAMGPRRRRRRCRRLGGGPYVVRTVRSSAGTSPTHGGSVVWSAGTGASVTRWLEGRHGRPLARITPSEQRASTPPRRTARVEPRVEAAAREQLVVGAALDDPAVLDGEDHVGAEDRGEPVRDRDRRAPLHQRLERLLHEPLAVGVERGGGLVEDRGSAGLRGSPARWPAAALPAGEAVAALADHGVVAVGEREDPVVDVRRPGGRPSSSSVASGCA